MALKVVCGPSFRVNVDGRIVHNFSSWSDLDSNGSGESSVSILLQTHLEKTDLGARWGRGPVWRRKRWGEERCHIGDGHWQQDMDGLSSGRNPNIFWPSFCPRKSKLLHTSQRCSRIGVWVLGQIMGCFPNRFLPSTEKCGNHVAQFFGFPLWETRRGKQDIPGNHARIRISPEKSRWFSRGCQAHTMQTENGRWLMAVWRRREHLWSYQVGVGGWDVSCPFAAIVSLVQKCFYSFRLVEESSESVPYEQPPRVGEGGDFLSFCFLASSCKYGITHQPITSRDPPDEHENKIYILNHLKIMCHQVEPVVNAPNGMNIIA